jgi:cytochrome b561
MEKPKRYHPALIALHWLLAFLIIFMLLVGMLSLKGMPNNPAKLLPLGFHMATGILILALMLVRIVVRMTTQKPVEATAGNRFLDFIGKLTHYALYLFAILMALSGIGISAQAGLVPIVFGASGAPLPEDFFIYPARYGHGYIAIILIVLILMHVGAALYHQVFRKDRLLSRMGIGKEQE